MTAHDALTPAVHDLASADYGIFIDNHFRPASSGATFAVTDPATGALLASIPDAGADDTRAAIDAASAALPAWSALPALARADLLRRAAAIMLERRDHLARVMTLEQGKPLSEASGEIGYAASFLTWFAGEAERAYGQIVPASVPNKRILVLRQPVGVCALITPWNFPAAMLTRKIAPALAAGCTVVCKPAEQTPLSALELGRVFIEAGFPAGVVNIVPCSDPIPFSQAIFADERVRKVSFTGSTEVGKILIRESAATVKRLSLELGGNAPFIVFDDADLDAAVTGAIASKFRNNGQTCVCANRIYVQRGIYDRFADAFTDAVSRLNVGNGLADDVQLGPLIDLAAREKVEAHIADALAQGAALLMGGSALPDAVNPVGTFWQPTVLGGVTASMRITHEETFGPVAPLILFDTEDEVIAAANDTPFGLAAYFFTRDISRVMRVAERLEYGIVGANDALPSTAQAPFGGVKQSGLGREGGSFGIDEYLEVKYLSLGV
ncbi:MAG: NAD-dependent succinate-semialdehyde dehydrogenase [Chloroflexota bacterium]|nr:NAD-dependent succinate-semialdehyde dehydrogenase [Chloroflexota bacterium]